MERFTVSAKPDKAFLLDYDDDELRLNTPYVPSKVLAMAAILGRG